MTLRAALYARKSTDQVGVADDQRSVARQTDHARAFATARGWTVLDDHVYVDDGISGAEFARRPGFVRLLAAIDQKPRPFDVLIMSEESRLGREAIETSYALKRIMQAGVRVWYYLDGRERTLDSPTDKLLMSVSAFADELEREKARQRVTDAMRRKAQAGHVTGGRVFGYDNVEIVLAGGKRSHVERRINPTEAAVVRVIFARYAAGVGLPTIAKSLNAAGVATPRAQRGRPSGWAPSAIRDVLRRPLYRGLVVWNRTAKRDTWGQQHRRDRPAADWIEVERPDLRIVDDQLWQIVQARAAAIEARYLVTAGRRGGRPPASNTRYLLAGLLRCRCGSGYEARTRSHGTGSNRWRVTFYGCAGYHRRGRTVCTNNVTLPAALLESAVLDVVTRELLDPQLIAEAVEEAATQIEGEAGLVDLQRLTESRDAAGARVANLAAAIGATGHSPALLAQLAAEEARVRELTRALDAATARREDARRLTGGALRAQLQARMGEWRELLRTHVPEAQAVLKALIVGRLTCAPVEGGVRFEGHGTWSQVLADLVPQNLASPDGKEELWLRDLGGFVPRAA